MPIKKISGVDSRNDKIIFTKLQNNYYSKLHTYLEIIFLPERDLKKIKIIFSDSRSFVVDLF